MRIHKAIALIFCIALICAKDITAQSANKSKDYNWMLEYTEPVPLAKAFIEKTKIFWVPTGKTMVFLTYKIGFTTAKIGGRYILLEAPNLAIDMVNKGAYAAISSVSYDALLEIIKYSVKSPDKLCVSIAQSTIKEGLRDYKIAYDIANKYIETSELTEEDAIIFLCNRWNFLKLGIARQLYLQSREEYNIDSQVGEKTTKILLDHFEVYYKSKIDINRNLPILEAAFFIKDLSDILDKASVGLSGYTPYLNYIKNIEELNKIKLTELERLGYQSCSGEKISYDNYTIIPGTRVGQINANTSLEKLFTIYGKENVQTKKVSIAEGTEEALHTFINGDELEIVWSDENTFQKPSMVIIPFKSNNYQTPEGIKNGMTVAEMQNVNGKCFQIFNYEIIPQWGIRDWQGGKLESYDNKISLFLENAMYDDNLYKLIEFQSDEKWIEKTGLKIVEIKVPLIENSEYLKSKIEGKEKYLQLPNPIREYVKNYNVPCYSIPDDLPDIEYMDLNSDGIKEYILWFVGCPDTRGRGIVFIFDGNEPERVLSQYFGYEVSGPVAINISQKKLDGDFHTIIIGNGDWAKELRFDKSVGRYELFW